MNPIFFILCATQIFLFCYKKVFAVVRDFGDFVILYVDFLIDIDRELVAWAKGTCPWSKKI